MKKAIVLSILFSLIFFSVPLNAFSHSIDMDFYEMFEEHGTIMLLLDSETGAIEHANSAASAFYGYSVEELESMKIHEINVLEPEEVNRRMHAAAMENRSNYVLEQQIANGDVRTVEVYACPHTYEDKTILFVTVYDITDRVLLQQKNRLIYNALIAVLLGTVVLIGAFSLILYLNFKKLKAQNKEISNFNELRRTYIDADNSFIYLKDNNLKYVFVNKALMDFYNKTSEEMIGHSAFDVAEKEYAILNEKSDMDALTQKTVVTGDVYWKDKVYQTTRFPVRLISGLWGVGAYIRDVTEEYMNKRRLEESEYLLRESQRAAHIGSFMLDIPAKSLTGSLEFYNIVGIDETYPHTEEGLYGIIHPDWRTQFMDYYLQVKSEKTQFDHTFKIIRRNDEKERWVRGLGGFDFNEQGDAVRFIGTIQDITDQKLTEEKILYLSYHDELTGLYNRRFFEEELKRLDTQRNLPISIVMGDMNGLKLTNDIFGHYAGDQLLMKITEVFKKVCRADDIIARVGGDEFMILLPRTKEEEAKEIMARIKERFSKVSVKAIKGSISMGCDTKRYVNQDIQQILKNAEDKMYFAKSIDREGVKRRTIKTIIETLHRVSPWHKSHSENVSEICENIGKAMGMSVEETRKLKDAGFLHDIGKIVLDESLLNKNETLTEHERRDVQQHSIIGYRILNSFDDTFDLAEPVLAHHERWDGSGYPRGLKGDEIPKLARIIAIAESYDAMTNKLSNNALSKEDAVKELRKQAGTKLDPSIVEIFAKMILKIG